MISSLSRILTIGRNTLTEAVRQKVLNVLLIFSLVLVGSSVCVSQLATPGLDSAGHLRCADQVREGFRLRRDRACSAFASRCFPPRN